ncbi:MAG TPA: sodium/proline symporter PutP [Rhodospirillales bacterium]|nr:sodium/proline symporter PutP [Rhodospirillales bacterium]
MSGWLLLGLPGAIYAGGMNQIWIGIGLVIGAYLNWQFVAERLRIYTEVAKDSLTIPDYLDNRFGDETRILRVISASVILLFFTFYVSAGFVGGGVLFKETFGLDYELAMWIGAAVIVSYTFLGGFLAVCWTDFFQGLMMFIALIIVPVVAVNELGGWDQATAAVAAVDPRFNDVFTDMTALGIVSLMGWGLGYFGQPHILVRFMAIRLPRDIPLARLINIAWMVFGLYGAVFVGYTGIAYFSGQPLANPETVFIQFCQTLFNPWVAGFLLAAILAAIMSTIDSQLLVCSSALTEDIYRPFIRKNASDRELVLVSRLSVVAVAVVAGLLAGDPDSRVLGLVSYAWAGFGAAFGPVILLSLFWRRMNRNGAAAGLVVGAVTVVVWKQLEGGLFDIYEIIPGFILSTVAVVAASLLTEEPTSDVVAGFDRTLDAKASGIIHAPAE